MPKHRPKSDDNNPNPHRPRTQAARPLAPDDVCVGDGVTVSYVILRAPVCDTPWSSEGSDATVPKRVIPEYSGTPLRVIDECVPYIVVKTPGEVTGTLDMRRYEVYRLDEGFTKRAFKRERSRAADERRRGAGSASKIRDKKKPKLKPKPKRKGK